VDSFSLVRRVNHLEVVNFPEKLNLCFKNVNELYNDLCYDEISMQECYYVKLIKRSR